MTDLTDKAERQHLKEERDAILACRAICEAARANAGTDADRLLKRIAELQSLQKDRDATLACLAICEAARAEVDEALKRINEERQESAPRDGKPVITSLSELIGMKRRDQSQEHQSDTPCSSGSSLEKEASSTSQRTNLAYRQLDIPSQIEEFSGIEGDDSVGKSPAGSQGDPHEESFVLVESLDGNVNE